VKRTILLILFPIIIFSYLSFVISQKACDSAMNLQAKKLIPFNHQSHLTEYDISNCEECHGFYDEGRFKGIPLLGKCRTCHNGDGAEEPESFKKYKDIDKPWESFAKQPDLVFFSHKVINTSQKKVKCSSCHGDKANSTTTDKIKGKMKMGECMDCHNSLKISNKCTICHD